MLTLDLMENIILTQKPIGQILAATFFVEPSLKNPFNPTHTIVENIEHIPKTGRIYLALNHTDRFNYWPLQMKLWRQTQPTFTVTWVKGKYFNNPVLGRFMASTNNIPTPSRGYLIASDNLATLGKPPSPEIYRIIRDTLDSPERDVNVAREQAREHKVLSDLDQLLKTPRDILGYKFNPSNESYFDALDDLFRQFMDLFIALNDQAFSFGHKVIVFPEGTRSLTLTKGRPGLAQMALRTNATIVPIGCNGSDKLYPGNSPISKGGTVTYRVGEPLTPEEALAPFQIDESYVPFTKDAERRFGDEFQGATDLIMERIASLLDPQYLPGARDDHAVQGANRFL